MIKCDLNLIIINSILACYETARFNFRHANSIIALIILIMIIYIISSPFSAFIKHYFFRTANLTDLIRRFLAVYTRGLLHL